MISHTHSLFVFGNINFSSLFVFPNFQHSMNYFNQYTFLNNLFTNNNHSGMILCKPFLNRDKFHMKLPSLFTIHTKLFQSEEHTSELQSRFDLVCRLLLEKKK